MHTASSAILVADRPGTSAERQPGHTCPHCARHVRRPIVGRHTVKELQRSIQPASPHNHVRTDTDMWSFNFDGHSAVYERHQSWI
ncbi:hypothetical protein J6590_020662 [Homalodisca vitripennis]|nr:hypothetical protein J6590_020662 [Homalodisca vitripennis]